MPLNKGITEFILISLTVPDRVLGFKHFSWKTEPKKGFQTHLASLVPYTKKILPIL
jgi:hypothetical protein